MKQYELSYEIVDYDCFYNRIYQIIHNPFNQLPVEHHNPIGYTSCGFAIEHLSIGTGPIHVVYMAGMHGNEIIGVDYVLQLMKNLALKNGAFERFDPHLFTIDFLPCQNPEGYFITTYALKSVIQKQNLSQFCYDYYQNYREDNQKINYVNQIIKICCEKMKQEIKEDLLIKKLWLKNLTEPITLNMFVNFLEEEIHLNDGTVLLVKTLWNQFQLRKINAGIRKYQKPFQQLSIDCIPEKDEKHIALKHSIKKMYDSFQYPFCSLANFFANANGVNLNDNNEIYHEILLEQTKSEKEVYSLPINGSIIKSRISPIGTTSKNSDIFTYEKENVALLNFLETVKPQAFFNCHGTGGLIYLYPYYETTEHTKIEERDFSFYINSRLITEYLNEISNVYYSYTGKKEEYKSMPHPKKVTTLGDILRMKYPASFLVELSKAGGNPIGPYITPNYELTMIANMNACEKVLETLLTLQHLYCSSYIIKRNRNGFIKYETRKRIQ